MSDTLKVFGTTYSNVAGIKATSTSSEILAYTQGGGGGITPSGTMSITSNGTYDVTSYASADVNVPTGVDIPVFTITFDSNWEAPQSITCNKTLNECYSLNYNGESSAFVIETDGVDEYKSTAFLYTVLVSSGIVTSLKYVAFNAYYDIVYTTNGITVNTPSDYPDELNATVNGTYTAQKIYKTVTVNVPTGTARTSSDLTVSGATVTAPAGLYAAAASATIPSGTEGTPTAVKGTVSNHQVSVTPSVTNTAGYISGGTKTGTAVTVTASELASGNKAITDNGTGIDVVGYSTVSVDVHPTYTATIVQTGNSNYAYVTYNSVKYYTLNDTFTFYAGDTLKIHGEGTRDGQLLYIDNELVSGYPYNYNYTLPSKDICIKLDSNPMSGSTANNKVFTSTVPTEKLLITSNGQLIVREYNEIEVSVSPNLQAKTNISPTTSSQTITPDSGYDGLSYVQINAMPTGDVPTSSGKEILVYSGYDETNSTSYAATDVSITVKKAGTYKLSWTGLRNTTNGTSGSRLYVDETAAGSAHTSGWIRGYGQYCEETLTLSANATVTVYARSRSANYYMVVGNLIAVEQ